MNTIIRDAPIGQLIRYITKNRVLLYPEEKPDYKCPNSYKDNTGTEKPDSASSTLAPTPAAEGHSEKYERPPSPASLRTAPTVRESNPFDAVSAHRTTSRALTRPEMQKITTRADLEQAYEDATQQSALRQESRVIEPEKTADGLILVDWYATDDSENPQNWTASKKGIVVLQIYLYTLAVYLGSAIITPAEPYLIEQFGITPTVASLVLALYVLGYGIGPLVWSPLSEIPSIGRNPPYMATFGIFVILCIPTALTNSFAGLLVLRFLQGFFGSPCLATGGASIGDLYNFLSLPYFLTGWAAFATAGPALGPLISGFSIPATNWHWSLWEMIWLAGPVFVSMMFFLPETSAPNILARRAARLRKASGNPNIKSQSELDQEKLTVNEVLVGNLIKPFQINVLDPAVGFTSVYTALIYAIYYSFFVRGPKCTDPLPFADI
jgi:DHA1 family multidrug resistance protein-like MFS transporter